jgi:hypothetical protein
MPQVDNFYACILEDTAHDVYGCIMAIKERCGSHHPDMVFRFINFNISAHVAPLGMVRMTNVEGRMTN